MSGTSSLTPPEASILKGRDSPQIRLQLHCARPLGEQQDVDNGPRVWQGGPAEESGKMTCQGLQSGFGKVFKHIDTQGFIAISSFGRHPFQLTPQCLSSNSGQYAV
eukprot:4268927-Amphidinium_carterae.1